MKPAPFRYHAPATRAEALELLAGLGADAAPLAGGQSLLPAMNLRLARPRHIVDLNRIPASGDCRAVDGHLHIGALVRHRALERPPVAGPIGDLLAAAARHVGHPPIRERGTFAGSLAHADPTAEWCAVTVALDATVLLASVGEQRSVAASSFFVAPFATARRPDELVVEARVPLLSPDHRTGFAEESRATGDFPVVCAAVALRVVDDVIVDARIGAGGIAPTPIRLQAAEEALRGSSITDAKASQEAGEAARAAADPIDDPNATAAYRRHLAGVVMERAVMSALGAPS
jgi:carbon-monoxide dehydrogenase medium subunit